MKIVNLLSTFICISINLFLISAFSYNPICWIRECCNEEAIPGDTIKLWTTLKRRVYGQHLVEITVDAITAHWSPYIKPQKALVLSFHGWPGSGKNYVSKFIAESLYKEGTKSRFVHHFIGRMHFPEVEQTRLYQTQLYEWLKTNITKCPKQLFIFDEVDKMPPGVLNAIKPMMDYRDNVDGVDYTQAIFILLSNTGSSLINEQYELYWNEGKIRENLRIKDFESLIAKGAFNEAGGFYLSDTIKSNLIDHYIPFLPMEHRHVKECIRDQFRERKVADPQEDHVDEVLEYVEWGPDRSKLFSKTGCKRISSKVGVLVAKHYPEQVMKKEL